MSAPLALDLCCGAGGCSKGYADAGFEVYGSDNEPHPDYPFEFHLGDVLEVLDELAATGAAFGRRPDFVSVSPPCKGYTDLRHLFDVEHPRLIGDVRERLLAWGGPYVIENVESAAPFMREPMTLCGSEFDLWADCRDGRRRQLRRHRLFESNVFLFGAGGCQHRGQPVGVYGEGGGGQMTRGYKAHPEEARQVMGIDWMSREDICQAIPPRFTQHIGEQLLAAIREDAAA